MPSDDKPEKKPSTPPGTRLSRDISGSALAFELPFTLVGPIAVGAAIGYFLDLRLHTKPWLTLILGALGFFAGLREVLRRLPGGNNGS